MQINFTLQELKSFLTQKRIKKIITMLGYSLKTNMLGVSSKLELLGAGAFGLVYAINDNFVIKFSTSLQEYNLANYIINHDYKHFAKYILAKKADYKDYRMYIIVMERLQPLTNYLSQQTLDAEIVHTFENGETEKLLVHEIIDILLDVEGGEVYDLGELYGQLLDYCLAHDKKAFELFKQLVDTRKELESNKYLEFVDLHKNNYGVRGNTFVVFDQSTSTKFDEYDDNKLNLNEMSHLKLHPGVNLIKNYKGGDLNLKEYNNVDWGLIIPENFHVTGDLILWFNKVITTLPEGLKVDGSLLLFQCTNFTTLPEGLKVGNILDVSDCNKLTMLPNKLQVYSINATRTNIISLPDDLISVEGSLNLQTCKKLKSLSNLSTVNGNLNLSYCTTLPMIPNNLEVGKDLWLSGCVKLQSIPSNLNVGRTIYLPKHLKNQTNLTEMKLHPAVNMIKNYKGGNLELILDEFDNFDFCKIIPENFHITGNLKLFGNTATTTLPTGLKVDGDLVIANCKRFESLPKNLIVMGDLHIQFCRNFDNETVGPIKVGGTIFLDN